MTHDICILCKRKLRNRASAEKGYGPACGKKIDLLELTPDERTILAAKANKERPYERTS